MSDVQSLLRENAALRERVRELEQQLRSETSPTASRQPEPLLPATAAPSASHANGDAEGSAASQPCQNIAADTTIDLHWPLGWTSAPHGLTHAQIARYSRHLLLPSFGVAGMRPSSLSSPARNI